MGYKKQIKYLYGLAWKDYEKMLAEQKGSCAICGGGPRTFNFLSVDHCHATGKVRGLLCERCNLLLANVQDDPAILLRAVEYLA